MMYGFGDEQNPYSESVDLLEDLVHEYITEMVCSTKYKFFVTNSNFFIVKLFLTACSDTYICLVKFYMIAG